LVGSCGDNVLRAHPLTSAKDARMAPLNQSDEAKSPQGENPLKPLLIPVVAIVIVLAALLLVQKFFPPVIPKPEDHMGVGRPLTHLELRPLTGDGAPISLADLQNRVTLLNFWGTWCPPCRQELPHIAELYQRFAGHKTFRLLAVSCPAGGQASDVESLQEETAALLKRLDLELPTYYDPDDGTQVALDRLIALKGFPTTVLLDRRGVIRAVWEGYRDGAETEMERYISQLLDEKK
jgi:cytochrome c biogenesis protein CcmG, thiol:disulfide interchange protein DsbE